MTEGRKPKSRSQASALAEGVLLESKGVTEHISLLFCCLYVPSRLLLLSVPFDCLMFPSVGFSCLRLSSAAFRCPFSCLLWLSVRFLLPSVAFLLSFCCLLLPFVPFSCLMFSHFSCCALFCLPFFNLFFCFLSASQTFLRL